MKDIYDVSTGRRGHFGTERSREIDPQDLVRDVRRPEEKFLLIVSRPAFSAAVIGLIAMMSWVWPWLVQIGWLIAGLLTIMVFSRKSVMVLPMRLPKSANIEDLNDPSIGRRGFNKARGVFYLGRDLSTQELWGADKDVVTHFLVFGTTGSGKSEFLLSLFANAVSLGSGGIFSDAKATNKLYWQLFQLLRRCGVDDQALVINYITGNVTAGERSVRRTSNTSNPFATGSADSAMQILGALVPTPEGDNAVFGQRAIALASATLFGLVDLRNVNELNLGVNTLRQHLNFQRLYALGQNPKVSERSRGIIRAYLEDLPGFDYGVPAGKQRDEVYRQFGFAVSYFTRALSSLSDTYGHIYWTDMGEVDMGDVVVNRRTLGILLPPMEKSPEELRNLGKISLTGVKAALAPGLGTLIEGTREEVLDNLPTASRVPYIVIADEYAYQCAEGFSVTAAQARGINIIFVFAAQDLPGMKKASPEEAQQIVANTKIKVGMALEDVEETIPLLIKVGAKARVAEVDQFERQTFGLGSNYRPSEIIRVQERDRVDVRDFQGMIEGEAIFFFRGRVIRAVTFYPDVGLPKVLRINRFMRVQSPDPAMLPSIKEKLAPLNIWFASRLDGRSAPSTESFGGQLDAASQGARHGVAAADGGLTVIATVMAAKYALSQGRRSSGGGSMGGMTPGAPTAQVELPIKPPTQVRPYSVPGGGTAGSVEAAGRPLTALELLEASVAQDGRGYQPGTEDDFVTDEDIAKSLAAISAELRALSPDEDLKAATRGATGRPVPPMGAAAPAPFKSSSFDLPSELLEEPVPLANDSGEPVVPPRAEEATVGDNLEDLIAAAIRQQHVYPVPPEPSHAAADQRARNLSLLDAVDGLSQLD